MNFLFQRDAGGVAVAALEAALSERDAEILRLKEELKASKQEDTVAQVSLYRKSRQQEGFSTVKPTHPGGGPRCIWLPETSRLRRLFSRDFQSDVMSPAWRL